MPKLLSSVCNVKYKTDSNFETFLQRQLVLCGLFSYRLYASMPTLLGGIGTGHCFFSQGSAFDGARLCTGKCNEASVLHQSVLLLY